MQKQKLTIETPAQTVSIVTEAPTVTIKIPIGDVTTTEYTGVGGHIDIGGLTEAQSIFVKGVFNALHAGGAKLANGRNVTRISDAARWIIEQGAAASTPFSRATVKP